MPVVCMLNQKGGVGKTSTCFHLSGTLAQLGRRVLLVDNDPQASLTQGFLGPRETRSLDPRGTIVSVFEGDEPFPGQVIRPAGPARVDLLPGSKRLTRFNMIPPESWGEAQGRLRDFLSEVAGEYGFIFIDCPPNLHLCSWSAMVAADHLVVPIEPEDFGAQGIADVREAFNTVAAGPNPGITLAGYLLTLVNSRRATHKNYEGTLRGMYGDDVFETAVPNNVDFVDSLGERKTVADFKPRGAAAKIMKALAGELEARTVVRKKGAA